jgi:hypothetical protein
MSILSNFRAHDINFALWVNLHVGQPLLAVPGCLNNIGTSKEDSQEWLSYWNRISRPRAIPAIIGMRNFSSKETTCHFPFDGATN